MTADLSALLDRLEAAAAAATPGPWAQAGSDSAYILGDIGDDGESYRDVADTVAGTPADAELIVAAVTALPTLVAELRAHQAAVQAVRELADELAGLGLIVFADRIRAAVADPDPKGTQP